MKEVKEYFKVWSEKTSLSVEEIESDFNQLQVEEKTKYPNLDEEKLNEKCLQTLALKYKKLLRSPAVGFEGIIIGMSEMNDMVLKMRTDAIKSFNENPQFAVEAGVCNEMGEPLDTRAQWANGKQNLGFGKPLPEHNYIRNIYGIALKSKSSDKPKYFSMSLNGEKAVNDNIPLFKGIRFMAIDRTPEELKEYQYNLNASLFTKFEEDKNLQLQPANLLKGVCDNMIVPLQKLGEYHSQNKDNYNRIVIINGTVSSLNLEPTAFGTRVMYIDNLEDIENLDAKGATCWVPPRIDVDFAEGSKVFVIGRTTQGKKKDATGQLTEELGDVSINVYGIYPETKVEVPTEITKLTEENSIQ